MKVNRVSWLEAGPAVGNCGPGIVSILLKPSETRPVRHPHLSPCLLALALVACGRDPDRGSTHGSASSAELPKPSTPLSTSPDAGSATRWTGKLEATGPSIVMQGTHKLVVEGKTVAFLKSSKVDLSRYEGKRVFVKGPSASTVEGGQVIVDVVDIEEVP